MKDRLVGRLLRRNLSLAQLAGFTLSNFIGLAIVAVAVQLWQDLRPIWEGDDSFMTRDYMVVNKKVTAANSLLGSGKAVMSGADLEDLRRQPWVRQADPFATVDYSVSAAVRTGSGGMSTNLFFESIPDRYIDVDDAEWRFEPGSDEVPLILSKDYLSLYNFGFASSAGLPQISEQMIGSVPLELRLTSFDGTRSATMRGRVVGFSKRLNTILVPEAFMQWSNGEFGSGPAAEPSRVAIDVSAPGDPAIGRYLKEHDLETGGDSKAGSASFLLNVAAAIVGGVGAVITLLSLFVLMLSISLLMQKNREKLHQLLMLGYPASSVARPYEFIVLLCSAVSLLLAVAALEGVRAAYIGAVTGLGGGGGWWQAPAVAVAITAVLAVANMVAVKRRVRGAWRS